VRYCTQAIFNLLLHAYAPFFIMDFIKAQLTKIPKITPVNLSKSTVLITGANSGLGFEAAREILHSKPERLILAVRNIEKGNAARKVLENAKPSGTKIDVRKLDQSSLKSVQDFVKELEGDKVDIAILNAG
jgi:retinol dehydrogenase-12